MQSLDTLVGRCAQWWVAVLVLVVTVSLTPGFAWRNAALERAAQDELARLEQVDPAAHARLLPAARVALDGRRTYSAAEVDDFLGAIGPDGRRIYWLSQLCFDVAFPLLYGALATILFAIGWRRWREKRDKPLARAVPRWFLALVITLVAADLLENAGSIWFAASGAPVSGLLVTVCSAATSAKWILSLAVGALVVVFWTWQSLAGAVVEVPRVMRYVFLSRVPLLVAAALLVIPSFADTLPTIGNMLVMETATDLAVVTFLAILLASVCGYAVVLVWDLAHVRFEVPPLPLTAMLRERGVVRAWPFSVFALPLIATLVFASTAPPDGGLGFVRATLAACAGILAANLLGFGIDRLRVKLTAQDEGSSPSGWAWNALQWILRRFGPGYFDAKRERIERGHVMSIAAVVVVGGLYGLGYFVLRDHPERMPALAYVLVLLLAVSLTLSGMAFFLDRFRFPLLLAIAVHTLVLANVTHRDHFFEVRSIARTDRVQIAAAIQARGALPAPENDPFAHVLTVVCASGGGIQAAGWTAQVLTGLQSGLGEGFTRSIHLLSTTSGGSVGAYHFLNAIDPQRGVPSTAALDRVVESSMASSLEATSWGLVYPDFARAFLPVPVSATVDRAWAMERAWLRHGAELAQELGRPEVPTLLDWMRGAKSGALPGVVFNATFVEDAQQFLATNLDLSVLRPKEASIPSDPGLESHYPRGPFDMDAVTAARLSATFPWVTPVARPLLAGGTGSPHHVADGGYFDNYGTVIAAQWLDHVLADADLRSRFDRLLVVEIRAFPPARPEDATQQESSASSGWVSTLIGPLVAIMGVRTSTQVVRTEIEMRFLEQLHETDQLNIRRIVVRPPAAKLGRERPDAPLSWHLAASDKRQIRADWNAVQEQHVEEVTTWLKE
ncbi:MAG: hypothetical protein GY711_23515 [bacterium]|nr:hypothetical protein [bacterium]